MKQSFIKSAIELNEFPLRNENKMSISEKTMHNFTLYLSKMLMQTEGAEFTGELWWSPLHFREWDLLRSRGYITTSLRHLKHH